MVRFNRKSERGFTLVELLIVIAIIGVLSTIGVPAFKRMVQKSKKTEAKTNLGGVYTAEQAFFSEYGAYGNNLFKVGYIVDGTANNLIYTVGFPSNTNCTGSPAYKPTTGTPIANAIATAFPAYYQQTMAGIPNTSYINSAAYTYNGSGAYCLVTVAGSANGITYILKDGTTASATMLTAGVYNYQPTGSSTAGESNGYLATATGVIASGVGKGTTTVTDVDAWYIDHERRLINERDGVK